MSVTFNGNLATQWAGSGGKNGAMIEIRAIVLNTKYDKYCETHTSGLFTSFATT